MYTIGELKEFFKKDFSLVEPIKSDLLPQDIVEVICSTPGLKVIPSKEGNFSTVFNENDLNDWGKNNDFFPFHLDGGYYAEVPKFVILYCAVPSESGGETFFCEGETVVNKLLGRYDEEFLYSLNVTYISPNKKQYVKPLIRKTHTEQQLNWYSSLYIQPDCIKLPDRYRRRLTTNIAQLILDIERTMYDSIFLEHKWEKHDLLLFNNQLLLHGRNKIPEGSRRTLYRIWCDHPDFAL